MAWAFPCSGGSPLKAAGARPGSGGESRGRRPAGVDRQGSTAESVALLEITGSEWWSDGAADDRSASSDPAAVGRHEIL